MRAGYAVNRLGRAVMSVMPCVMRAAWTMAAMSAMGSASAASAASGGGTPDLVEIRRTVDGIAHIRAQDMRGAGFGMGHAQAQDALCTLAEAFVTYEGSRAFFFGPEGRPRNPATFVQASNLELDVFFRGFVDRDAVQAYKAAQSPQLLASIAGFAQGYNRSLSEQRLAHKAGSPKRACLFAPWVRPITSEDVLRRLYAAGLAAGYAHFVPELVHARPPGDGPGPQARASLMNWPIGERAGIGSNALAFGQEASGEGSVLLGNPHWYWGGPDRLYQAHLSIPGQLDVAGASFLGVPLIMIGFNADVAWTHTVSKASRFSFHVLTLDPSDPLAYIVDGVSQRMQAHTVTVPIKDPQGKPAVVTRTLYRTRFGPVISLGGLDSALGWTRATAVAIRDVNAGNTRIFQNYLDWNKARSLDAFVAVQKKALAVPWVNTLAIGRDDPRAWYGDIGAVPGIPDDVREACRTPLGDAYAQMDPQTPFLDGSRAACDWRVEPGTPQAGIMPADRLPGLFRRDAVANMNDSHWLSSPRQPLLGYARLIGGEREALSLRGRHGHAMVARVLAARHTSSASLVRSLRQLALNERDHAADLFKTQLLQGACARPVVSLPQGATSGDKAGDVAGDQGREQVAVREASMQKGAANRPVDVSVREACAVLARWRNTAGPHDRGPLLWSAFWERLEALGPDALYGRTFDPASPLDTPAEPRAQDPRIAQALAATVASFKAAGRALDEPLGQHLQVRTGGRTVPLFGGCGAGYFAVACAPGETMDGALDGRSTANSYLQLVRFGPRGVEADTLLAHGLDEAAVEGGQGSGPVIRYARKQWLSFPFTDSAIERQLQRRQWLRMDGQAQ